MTAAFKTIDREKLLAALDYDPLTGLFVWKVDNWSNKLKGRVAGSLNPQGYVQIQIDGVILLAHRLAWLYVHGAMPEATIDHKSGIRNDNRINNLRQATQGQQCENVAIRSNNTSGAIGVSFNRRLGKWHAYIRRAGEKRRHLGFFADPECAAAAYVKAKAELHQFQPTLRPNHAEGRI